MPAPATVADTPAHLRGLTVWVLDDHDDLRQALAWRAALGPRQPALLATGDPDSPDAQALRAEGIAVLTKPWPEAELLRAIRAAVAAARA